MTRDDLISELSQEMRSSRAEAVKAINRVFNTIEKALLRGEKVQIPTFGTFEVITRAPRVGRNPRTNTPVNIPERQVPNFKASEALKEAVRKCC